jgi:hypothetical protein
MMILSSRPWDIKKDKPWPVQKTGESGTIVRMIVTDENGNDWCAHDCTVTRSEPTGVIDPKTKAMIMRDVIASHELNVHCSFDFAPAQKAAEAQARTAIAQKDRDDAKAANDKAALVASLRSGSPSKDALAAVAGLLERLG